MNLDAIPDPDLRRRFRAIVEMRETELAALGLNSAFRDGLLRGIVVPRERDACWIWHGGVTRCSGKRRPAIWFKGKQFLAYRILVSLLQQKPISTLNWILHKCPGRENGECVNPLHLREAASARSAASENAQDRSRYGAIHGDKNGSRKHPESRPRGRKNPKSKFRGPNGVRLIQIIRATYDKNKGVEGIMDGLSRWCEKCGNPVSANTIGCLVRRERHLDVPDDPSAALNISELDVRGRHSSAGRRRHWPRGDSNKQSRVPEAAKRRFVEFFHRIPQRRDKRRLIEFVAGKYGIKYATAQSLGYVDPEEFGASSREVLHLLPRLVRVTQEFLTETFLDVPPLKTSPGDGKR